MAYKDKEKAKEQGRKWYRENREKKLAQNRKWLNENWEKMQEYRRAWQSKNPDKLKAYSKKWRDANREKMQKAARDWRAKNLDYMREYRRKYEKERYASDPQFTLTKRLRNRLRSALRRGYKAGSSIKDLGCSVGELKAHIEKLFTDGMCWENRHLWEIDHIIPLASFDLTNREQFLKACHYTNLQPLWKSDNARKRDRLVRINSITYSNEQKSP